MSHDLTLKSHDFSPIQGDYSTGTGAPPPTTGGGAGGGGGGFWTGGFSASLTSVEFVMLSDDLSFFHHRCCHWRIAWLPVWKWRLVSKTQTYIPFEFGSCLGDLAPMGTPSLHCLHCTLPYGTE